MRRTFQSAPLESDYDFFFANKKQFESFRKQLEGRGASKIKQNDNNILFKMPSRKRTEDDISAHPKLGTWAPELDIQLINFQYYNTLEEVLESFDFTITQFGYDGEHFIMSDFALWDLARRKLVPCQLTYATSSLRRLLKYSSQGFSVCNGGLSEILEQVVNKPEIIEADVLYID